MKIANRDRWASIFYWIGAVSTFTAIALVLLGNTKWGAAVQHTSFPLAWKLAIVAVVAFLVREICRPDLPQGHTRDSDSRHALDHTPYEI
jgi:hypothetical protein